MLCKERKIPIEGVVYLSACQKEKRIRSAGCEKKERNAEALNSERKRNCIKSQKGKKQVPRPIMGANEPEPGKVLGGGLTPTGRESRSKKIKTYEEEACKTVLVEQKD